MLMATRTPALLAPRAFAFAPLRRSTRSARAVRARAAAEEPKTFSTEELEATKAVEMAEPEANAPSEAKPFSLLNGMSEIMNGRAAMLGMLAAVVSELSSGKGVWTQIFARYEDGDLVASSSGTSVLLYGFVVVFVTVGSLSHKLQGADPDSRSFGPFSPNAELMNGRLAMMGFSGLILAENFMGGNAIF